MFEIDRLSRKPIYEQLIAGFETAIICGELKGGEMLPSVRTLSQQLSVNPNTLQKAYQELERRNICFSTPGSGRYIENDAAAHIMEARVSLLGEIELISYKLRESGIPQERVYEAVKRAYGETDSTSNKK